MSRVSLTCVLVSSFWVAACGGGGGSSSRAPDAGGGGLCASDTMAVPYSAGMSETSPGGVKVAILNAEPAPPAQGGNVWNLVVTDSGGAKVTGATVSVQCLMKHATTGSHGCPKTPDVAEKGDGAYDVSSLYFNMGGHWEVTITVQPAGGAAENVVFPLCIE